jgi:hypothetical protein
LDLKVKLKKKIKYRFKKKNYKNNDQNENIIAWLKKHEHIEFFNVFFR